MTRPTYTFPYRCIDTTKFPRPYVPVTLRNKQRVMEPLLALVDSGADFCLFDAELSYLLDLDLTTLETISLSGVAGAAEGYVAHIEIGVQETFVPVPVVFSFDFSPKGFGGVIGQVGFFDRLIVAFDRANATMIIESIKTLVKAILITMKGKSETISTIAKTTRNTPKMHARYPQAGKRHMVHQPFCCYPQVVVYQVSGTHRNHRTSRM